MSVTRMINCTHSNENMRGEKKMRKYKQVKEKKVTYDLDEWREVEYRAAKLNMKTGTYINAPQFLSPVPVG
jgi:hypothetical protein